MNRDDIIRMAREAGFTDGDFASFTDLIVHFGTLVAAAEREAILKMSEDNWFKTQDNYEAAIRARGQT
jgi:hypothetical protein